MGKYYDLYSDYALALSNYKYSLIKESMDKHIYIGKSALSFKEIYQVNITTDNFNGIGAKTFTQEVASVIFENFKKYQNFFGNTLRVACTKAINELLPTIEEIHNKDEVLSSYLGEYRSYQNAIDNANSSLKNYSNDSSEFAQINRTISAFESKANDVLAKIKATIEELKALCSKTNRTIKEIWALNGESSTEIQKGSINYDFFPNGANKLDLLKYCDDLSITSGLTTEIISEELSKDNSLLSKIEVEEDSMPDYSVFLNDKNSRINLDNARNLIGLMPGLYYVETRITGNGKKVYGELALPPNFMNNKGIIVTLKGNLTQLIKNGKIEMPKDKVVFSPYYQFNKDFTTSTFYDMFDPICKTLSIDPKNKQIIGFSVGAQNLEKTIKEHLDYWKSIILLDSGLTSMNKKYFNPENNNFTLVSPDYDKVHVYESEDKVQNGGLNSCRLTVNAINAKLLEDGYDKRIELNAIEGRSDHSFELILYSPKLLELLGLELTR